MPLVSDYRALHYFFCHYMGRDFKVGFLVSSQQARTPLKLRATQDFVDPGRIQEHKAFLSTSVEYRVVMQKVFVTV